MKTKIKKILIVACTHGHEVQGLKVIKILRQNNLLKTKYKNLKVDFLIANKKAMRKKVAFLESDLNRVFPGKEEGNYEERLAFEISKKIINYDLVIDIHSTNTIKNKKEEMIIFTNISKRLLEILKVIAPSVCIHMKYKNKNALISSAKLGFAFEYGDNSYKTAKKVSEKILKVLDYLGDLNIYKVYNVFKKPKSFSKENIKVKNFQLVKKGNLVAKKKNKKILAKEDFYPVLFGENRYKDIFGFKAKKIFTR